MSIEHAVRGELCCKLITAFGKKMNIEGYFEILNLTLNKKRNKRLEKYLIIAWRDFPLILAGRTYHIVGNLMSRLNYEVIDKFCFHNIGLVQIGVILSQIS